METHQDPFNEYFQKHPELRFADHLRVRDMINYLSWYLVDTLHHRHGENAYLEDLERRNFSEEDEGKVRDIIEVIGLRFKQFPKQIHDSYLDFWQSLWDVCSYHFTQTSLGSSPAEKDSRFDIALKMHEERPSDIRDIIEEAQHFIDEGNYPALIDYVLEKCRKQSATLQPIFNVPYSETGFQLAAAEAKLAVEMFSASVDPSEDEE